MELLTHMISLSVGVTGPDDHAQTFQDLSELAGNLTVAHPYVSVSSTLAGDYEEEDDTTECNGEHLHHDEQTLVKIYTVMSNHGISEASIQDIVNELQNAGILFRERGDEGQS